MSFTKEDADKMLEEMLGRKTEEVKAQLRANHKSAMEEMLYREKYVRPVTPRNPLEVKHDMACFLGCLTQEGFNLAKASALAKIVGNDIVAKALGSSTIAGGSVFINPDFAGEIIPLLRSQAVMFRAGARVVPMPSGRMIFGRVGTGATAAYRGESSAITVSQPATENLELNARLLGVICPVSNQLLSRGATSAQFIQDELINACSDKMDSTLIRSTGTAHEPKGLLHWAASAHKFNEANGSTTGASTLAQITNDLGKCVQFLEDAKHPMLTPAWLFAPRTKKRLMSIRDSNGNYAFRDEMRDNELNGYPWFSTPNIPTNLSAASTSGSGSDASEVYFADFSNILVGETESLAVSMSSEASYVTGGTTYNAFQLDETLVKVTMEHDQIARYSGTEIAVIESVTWGTV